MTAIDDSQAFILKLTLLSNKFTYYSIIIFGNIGCLSNILNILVCSRNSIRQKKMGFYNIIISTFNIMIFAVGFLQYYPPTVGGQNFFLISDLLCIIMSSSSRILIHMASWLKVMLSFDRLMCITISNRIKFINNKYTLSFIMVGMFITISTFSIPNLFFRLQYTSSFNSITNQTNPITITCTSSKSINLIRDLLSQIIRTVIPFILEIILNTILIYKLIKSKKGLNISRSLNKEYRFAFTTVMLNFAFIITQAPLFVWTVYIDILSQKSGVDPRLMALSNFLYLVFTLFASYLYGSIFFVNLLFNKLFQKEIRMIFGINVAKENSP